MIECEPHNEDTNPTVILISYLSNRGSAKVEVSFYDRSLKVETLIDWIGEHEIYFEYENVCDPNRVHFSITKLKGHAVLWWGMLQKDRLDCGLEKIKTWKKMVTKIKEKFFACRLLAKLV